MFDSNTFAFTHKYVPSKCVHCAADPEYIMRVYAVLIVRAMIIIPHTNQPTHTPKTNKQTLCTQRYLIRI